MVYWEIDCEDARLLNCYSYVPAFYGFSLERACKTTSRYRLLSIFPQAGMRDDLALPLAFNFSSSGHARNFFIQQASYTRLLQLLSFFFISSSTPKAHQIRFPAAIKISTMPVLLGLLTKFLP
jgi:hypothetical protein